MTAADIQAALRSDDVEVRRDAVLAAGSARDPEVASALLTALGDADWRVRAAEAGKRHADMGRRIEEAEAEATRLADAPEEIARRIAQVETEAQTAARGTCIRAGGNRRRRAGFRWHGSCRSSLLRYRAPCARHDRSRLSRESRQVDWSHCGCDPHRTRQHLVELA